MYTCSIGSIPCNYIDVGMYVCLFVNYFIRVKYLLITYCCVVYYNYLFNYLFIYLFIYVFIYINIYLLTG